MFLEYLYSGQLDMGDLSTEQIADMMAVADRYEVSKTTRVAISKHNTEYHTM